MANERVRRRRESSARPRPDPSAARTNRGRSVGGCRWVPSDASPCRAFDASSCQGSRFRRFADLEVTRSSRVGRAGPRAPLRAPNASARGSRRRPAALTRTSLLPESAHRQPPGARQRGLEPATSSPQVYDSDRPCARTGWPFRSTRGGSRSRVRTPTARGPGRWRGS
jgi:hypothetical protein